jgi:hypothetical protein
MQRLGRLGDVTGDLDVGTAGCGIAGGMVVNQTTLIHILLILLLFLESLIPVGPEIGGGGY